jgi:hypothetical protein
MVVFGENVQIPPDWSEDNGLAIFPLKPVESAYPSKGLSTAFPQHFPLFHRLSTCNLPSFGQVRT